MIKEMYWAIYSHEVSAHEGGEMMFWAEGVGWVWLQDATLYRRYPVGMSNGHTFEPVPVIRVDDQISVTP